MSSEISERTMSDDFDSLDASERAAVEAALNRCRVLAGQIESKLRHKRPEHFVDEFSLADLYASFVRAADVLRTEESAGRTPAQKREWRQHGQPFSIMVAPEAA
jgi:glutathione S-transferase